MQPATATAALWLAALVTTARESLSKITKQSSEILLKFMHFYNNNRLHKISCLICFVLHVSLDTRLVNLDGTLCFGPSQLVVHVNTASYYIEKRYAHHFRIPKYFSYTLILHDINDSISPSTTTWFHCDSFPVVFDMRELFIYWFWKHPKIRNVSFDIARPFNLSITALPDKKLCVFGVCSHPVTIGICVSKHNMTIKMHASPLNECFCHLCLYRSVVFARLLCTSCHWLPACSLSSKTLEHWFDTERMC